MLIPYNTRVSGPEVQAKPTSWEVCRYASVQHCGCFSAGFSTACVLVVSLITGHMHRGSTVLHADVLAVPAISHWASWGKATLEHKDEDEFFENVKQQAFL